MTLDPTELQLGGAGRGNSGQGGGALAPCALAQTGGATYLLCAEPLSQLAAEQDCAGRDARLAQIGSEQENAFIAEQARALGTNSWLGGTRDDDSVWRWPDGSVFWRGGADGSVESGAYARWQPGEPNDSSTVLDEPERCLALTLGGDDWNDRACSLALPYVCEQ